MSNLSTVVRGTPSYVAGNAKFGVGGLSGAVLSATGADSFLSSTGADNGAITTGTVEGWFKSPAVTATRVAFAHPGWYWVGADASGNATAHYGTPATEVVLSSTKQIADGAWHHIALVFQSGAGSLYVDGTRVATSATTKSTASDPSGPLKFYLGGLNGTDGTFDWLGSIDEVRISTNARYTGTTYTTPTAAFAVDATTADLWHLESNGDATVPVTILPNDTNIVYSPYNWLVTSGTAKTINPGAYLRTTITGSATAINACFDVANDAAPLPQISYRIDHGPWQSTTVASTIPITLPTGNTWATHTVELAVKSATETQNRWNAPQNTAVTFLGFGTTPGTAAPAKLTRKRGLNILTYGDSITEGARTLNMNATNDTDRNDSTLGWAYLLGALLGAEVGVVGFGATGVTVAGSGNVPNLGASYNQLWSGQSRSFTPVPDLILLNIGTNDPAGTDITAATTTLLNNLLAATPATTRIGVMYPWNGSHAAHLAAAVAACNSTVRVKVIDTTGWWNSADASDALHPYGYINESDLAPRLATSARAILNGGGMYLNVGGAAVAVANVRQ